MNPGFHKAMRIVGAILVALFFQAAAVIIVSAQTINTQKETGDVQQLKDKVRQLEQTVEELKKQIGSIESSQAKTDAAAVGEKGPAEPPIVSDKSVVKPVGDKPAQDKKDESTLEIYGFAMLDAGYQFGQ